MGNSVLFISFFIFSFGFLEAEKAPTVYVVGDLLVDVGNNNYLSLSIEKVLLPHYGIHFPTKKPTRRFSNGKKCCRFNWSVIQSLLYWFFKLSYHKLFTLLQVSTFEYYNLNYIINIIGLFL